MPSLSSEQITQLLKPINPTRVLHANGQSHVPAYDVAAHLTRLFGFGNWDTENCVATLCFEEFEERVKGTPPKPYKVWTVGYRATIRLVIKDMSGNEVAHYENGAAGDAINQPSRGDAHHLAMTTAISTALKRCAAFGLGDQFGLSLYNKGSLGPLVLTSLVGMDATTSKKTDVEANLPLPLSLGNDERQETGQTPPDTSEGGKQATKDISATATMLTDLQTRIREHKTYVAMASTEKGSFLSNVLGFEVKSIREIDDDDAEMILAALRARS